jgi:hypothetical protein
MILGVKSYPRGVTTNSDGGIESYESYYPIFEAMQEVDMILNLHGEVPSDPNAASINSILPHYETELFDRTFMFSTQNPLSFPISSNCMLHSQNCVLSSSTRQQEQPFRLSSSVVRRLLPQSQHIIYPLSLMIGLVSPGIFANRWLSIPTIDRL